MLNDEETFRKHLRRAASLVQLLGSKKEKQIAAKWMVELNNFKNLNHLILLIISLQRKCLVGPFRKSPETIGVPQLRYEVLNQYRPADMQRLIQNYKYGLTNKRSKILTEISPGKHEYASFKDSANHNVEVYYAFSPVVPISRRSKLSKRMSQLTQPVTEPSEPVQTTETTAAPTAHVAATTVTIKPTKIRAVQPSQREPIINPFDTPPEINEEDIVEVPEIPALSPDNAGPSSVPSKTQPPTEADPAVGGVKKKQKKPQAKQGWVDLIEVPVEEEPKKEPQGFAMDIQIDAATAEKVKAMPKHLQKRLGKTRVEVMQVEEEAEEKRLKSAPKKSKTKSKTPAAPKTEEKQPKTIDVDRTKKRRERTAAEQKPMRTEDDGFVPAEQFFADLKWEPRETSKRVDIQEIVDEHSKFKYPRERHRQRFMAADPFNRSPETKLLADELNEELQRRRPPLPTIVPRMQYMDEELVDRHSGARLAVDVAQNELQHVDRIRETLAASKSNTYRFLQLKTKYLRSVNRPIPERLLETETPALDQYLDMRDDLFDPIEYRTIAEEAKPGILDESIRENLPPALIGAPVRPDYFKDFETSMRKMVEYEFDAEQRPTLEDGGSSVERSDIFERRVEQFGSDLDITQYPDLMHDHMYTPPKVGFHRRYDDLLDESLEYVDQNQPLVEAPVGYPTRHDPELLSSTEMLTDDVFGEDYVAEPVLRQRSTESEQLRRLQKDAYRRDLASGKLRHKILPPDQAIAVESSVASNVDDFQIDDIEAPDLLNVDLPSASSESSSFTGDDESDEVIRKTGKMTKRFNKLQQQLRRDVQRDVEALVSEARLAEVVSSTITGDAQLIERPVSLGSSITAVAAPEFRSNAVEDLRQKIQELRRNFDQQVDELEASLVIIEENVPMPRTTPRPVERSPVKRIIKGIELEKYLRTARGERVNSIGYESPPNFMNISDIEERPQPELQQRFQNIAQTEEVDLMEELPPDEYIESSSTAEEQQYVVYETVPQRAPLPLMDYNDEDGYDFIDEENLSLVSDMREDSEEQRGRALFIPSDTSDEEYQEVFRYHHYEENIVHDENVPEHERGFVWLENLVPQVKGPVAMQRQEPATTASKRPTTAPMTKDRYISTAATTARNLVRPQTDRRQTSQAPAATRSTTGRQSIQPQTAQATRSRTPGTRQSTAQRQPTQAPAATRSETPSVRQSTVQPQTAPRQQTQASAATRSRTRQSTVQPQTAPRQQQRTTARPAAAQTTRPTARQTATAPKDLNENRRRQHQRRQEPRAHR